MSEPWERRETGKEQRTVPFYMTAIVAGAVVLGALQLQVKMCAVKAKKVLCRVKRKKRTVE